MKVMIGMDDSPHSRAALEFVRAMRWPLGTEFVVLSVARPAVVAHSLMDAGGIAFLQTVEKETVREHEELVARVEREFHDAGFPSEGRVVLGDARERLVEIARDEGADLLVVGSHGRTGLDKLIMGSVASHVVSHAACSVMVVKLPKEERSAPRGAKT